MGIPELWNIIGDGEVVPIAQLAAEHFQRHGRPLRIAVDEPSWRFKNLNEKQVYIIREKSDEPAYQGTEKNTFFRICHLLVAHVQLLFVFDGPKRPWKRGRPAGKIDYEKQRLTKQLFSSLKIPYHEAPAEAEAECVQLQKAGVVDAVWTEDSDALMFGCTFLIRDYRVSKVKGDTSRAPEDTKKSGTLVRVTRDMRRLISNKLDREGLVLFAMLVGGDYNLKGLPGCGPATAMRAIRAGLGRTLCQCKTKRDTQLWRISLLELIGGKVPVPLDFPDLATLNKYNLPKVSPTENLLDLRGLRNGWELPFDDEKLAELTSTRFNIWKKGYLQWMAPIKLVRLFAKGMLEPEKLAVLDIQVPRRRGTKQGDTAPPPLMRRVTFSPFSLTTFERKDYLDGYWGGKKDIPFDPNYRVDCELPEYFIRKGLPENIIDPPAATKAPASRKAKRKADDELMEGRVASTTEPPKVKRSRNSQAAAVRASPAATRAFIPNFGTPPTTHTRVVPSSRATILDLGSDSDSDSDGFLDALELMFPRSSGKPSLFADKANKNPGSSAPRPQLSSSVKNHIGSQVGPSILIDDELLSSPIRRPSTLVPLSSGIAHDRSSPITNARTQIHPDTSGSGDGKNPRPRPSPLKHRDTSTLNSSALDRIRAQRLARFGGGVTPSDPAKTDKDRVSALRTPSKIPHNVPVIDLTDD